MSGEKESDDKQYDASSKKLDDARKKGEVPRSADLISAFGYGGLFFTGFAFGAVSLSNLGTTFAGIVERADNLSYLIFEGSGRVLFAAAGREIASDLAPWMLFPGICSLLAVLSQRSFTINGSKLIPQFNRISIISNAKKKFDRNGLFEFTKSFVKLIIYTFVLGIFLWIRAPDIRVLTGLDPNRVTLMMLRLSLTFFMLVLVVALVLGGIDFIWQRSEYLRNNRMSHKEVLDESKEAEGDPHMKQKRQQKGYDIAMNQMMNDVKTADVVIVNPTHYAVALKWHRQSGRAPVCVAKGVNEIAGRIRVRAQEYGVQLHSDPPTARLLHRLINVGDEVQREQYVVVASAIRFAESMRKKAHNP